MSFKRHSSQFGEGRRPARLPLLLPLVLVILATWAGLILLEERFFQAQSRRQIEDRAATVAKETGRQLDALRRAHQTYARLLADTPGLVPALERSEAPALDRLLEPIRANEAFEEITIYDAQGSEILELGRPRADRIDASLFASGLAGQPASEVLVDASGLVVVGAAPINEGSRILGVVVVGSTLTDSELNGLKRLDGVELAFFEDESLVTTSVRRGDLLAVVRTADLGEKGLERLNHKLGGFRLHGKVQPLGEGSDRLLALASTSDLRAFADQRKLVLMGASVPLLAALAIVALFIRRTVTRPLKAMAAVTGRMVAGDYSGRVTPSRIPELDVLAGGINHLAERVEGQLRDLSHQAFHDALTGLPNRALCIDRLEQALVRAPRLPGSVAVLFLDLDDFKLVNDSLGHEVADGLLIAVADRLRGCLRAGDTLARLGGDEFTVLLEDVGRLEDALAAAGRLQEALTAPFQVGDTEVFITASIGITITGGQDPLDVLLREADLAMYRAKANGKARYEVFDEGMSAQLRERLAVQADLRHAVERNQLRVHYQPIVDLATGRTVEVEALVRWEHPERGLVPPLGFIPLAEETGLIVPLGKAVLAEACRQLSVWRDQGRAPLALAVNLSAKQFQDPALVSDVARILADSHLDPRLLKLEITESTVMENVDSALRTMEVLTDLGVKLVIDDFGTGYSSLSYLKRFPIAGLKVDKSFVDGVARDPADFAIVRATVDFARSMGLEVTAEGIEDGDQLRRLRSLGCDLGQGYYFSRPLPAGEVEEHLDLVASPEPQMDGRGAAEAAERGRSPVPVAPSG